MRKQFEEKQFEEEVLSIDRVTRVNTGGRRLRFRAVVIVGDKKGKIGLGTGKANEVVVAVQKATKAAKKQMITVMIFNDTVPHNLSIKNKSSKILLLPAGPGTGIKAGSVIRKILALAGYKNIMSKMIGSSNKLLNAQTTFKALTQFEQRKQVPLEQKPEGVAPVEKKPLPKAHHTPSSYKQAPEKVPMHHNKGTKEEKPSTK